MSHPFASVMLGLLLAGNLVAPARATSFHTYGKDDYARVGDGMAPNKKYSIAAHGHGEDGDEDFHLYLMEEPGHRKIGPLEEIKSILDTAPEAFQAKWSANSRFVALLHRADRHLIELHLYRIENGRAYPITGPSLISAASGFDVETSKSVLLRAKSLELTWLGSGRFQLKEEGTLTAPPDIALPLGKFGTAKDTSGPNDAPAPSQVIEYKLVGECEIVDGEKFKVIGVKPGG